jgi:hypothetical protein
MPPKESDSLISKKYKATDRHLSMEDNHGDEDVEIADSINNHRHTDSSSNRATLIIIVVVVITAVGVAILGLVAFFQSSKSTTISSWLLHHTPTVNLTGPYRLIEVHHGSDFFDYYEFSDGPDSQGSAGYNTYVGKEKASKLGLISVETDEGDGESYVYMSSTPGTGERDKYGNLFRDSVRLEGKTRFDRGLIVLDVKHMPAGCGVWPAFWTTDEGPWPNNGEIDIVEGINNQDVVKTALHTSEDCSMYAHVPRWAWSGEWDTSTGLPDTFTGQPNYNNKVEADNCWVMTPHQVCLKFEMACWFCFRCCVLSLCHSYVFYLTQTRTIYFSHVSGPIKVVLPSHKKMVPSVRQ